MTANVHRRRPAAFAPRVPLAALAALALLATALSGCSSPDESAPAPEEVMGAVAEEVPEFHLRDVSQGGARLASELSVAQRARYVIPQQADRELPETQLLHFEGSVTPDQCGLEAPQDAGATSLSMEPLSPFDFSASAPAGMPVEVHSTLKFNPDVGNQADLDLWVSLPGVEDGRSTMDDGAWNSASYTLEKRRDMTAGNGQPMLVGVECSEYVGGPGLAYTIDVELTFAQNVLTPHVAYQIPVPPETSHLLLASSPMGASPVKSSLILTTPSGTTQHFDTAWNDTADRLVISVQESGTYTFYADAMSGGFLTILSDAPLPDEYREITMVWPEVTELDAADFTAERVPLKVNLIWPASTLNVATNVTISSPHGAVLSEERVARADVEGNAAGLSNDATRRTGTPANLQVGAYTITVEGDMGTTNELRLQVFYAPPT